MSCKLVNEFGKISSLVNCDPSAVWDISAINDGALNAEYKKQGEILKKKGPCQCYF